MKTKIVYPLILNCVGAIILIFNIDPPTIGFAIGLLVFAIMMAIWAD
jgi:hypothetical protein